MKGIEYRAGNFDDVDSVAQLACDVYQGGTVTWHARMSGAIVRENSCFLVACADGVVIGYGKSGLCEPTSDQDQAPAGHYLTGVIVDPAWRRLGIGAELTRRRLAGIWSRGEAARFFTNTRNQASLELHAALGFVEIGRAASYLGEPFDGGSGVLLRADPPPVQS